MRPDEPGHGTRHAIRDLRCRCDVCRRVVAREQNEYRLRREAHGGPLLIDKTAAVRRIRGLMAIGWPRRELSARAGWRGDAVSLILDGRKNLITVTTDQRISDLYARLSMTPGPSAETRRRARLAGWAPPLAWDDIDDPDEVPRGVGYAEFCPNDIRVVDEVDEVVVRRILNGDWRLPCTRAEKEAVVARWTGGRNDLARLTGWKVERYVMPAAQEAAS